MLLIAGVLLVPYLFGYRPTAVLTGSMEPVYHVGSVIFVQEVEPEEIKVGDVITFSTAGMSYPTTHRVVSIDTDQAGFRHQRRGQRRGGRRDRFQPPAGQARENLHSADRLYFPFHPDQHEG